MMMKTTPLLLSFLLIFCVVQIQPSNSASLDQQCNDDVKELTPCIHYANGVDASPTADCCTVVSDIKTYTPVCFCYIIQQTHHGQAVLKALGLQVAKLLQLPTACNLANASLSDCPKLLNLTPNSPDVAIFTNSSSASAPSNSSSPTETPDSKSNGFKHGTQVAGPIAITIVVAIFISVLPTGLSSQLLFAEA